MADSPKPHIVQRRPVASATPAEPAPAKKPVEARPTCKLDRNELLGLVGNMRIPTSDPDAEPDVEIGAASESSIPLSKPSKSPVVIEKKIVRTVARKRTPAVGMTPLSAAPAPQPAKPVEPKPAATDEFVDLFAEGSDPTIDVNASSTTPAPTASSVATPSSELDPTASPVAAPLAAPITAVANTEIEMPPDAVRLSGAITLDGHVPGSGDVVDPVGAPEAVAEPTLTAAPDELAESTPAEAAAPAAPASPEPSLLAEPIAPVPTPAIPASEDDARPQRTDDAPVNTSAATVRRSAPVATSKSQPLWILVAVIAALILVIVVAAL